MPVLHPWQCHITPLGGAMEIGASATLLSAGDLTVQVDCGIRPSPPLGVGVEPLWVPPQPAREPQALLLTHAHIDHIGAVPQWHRRHPQAPIYATPPTLDLMRISLGDAVRLHEREMEGAAPYTAEDIEHLLQRCQPLHYGRRVRVLETAWGHLEVDAAAAGHILGAACLQLTWQDRHGLGVEVVCSGDVSGPQLTLPAADEQAMGTWRPDAVLLEGTYGVATHPPAETEWMRLLVSVAERVQAGGSVLIPAFAVGRAQNVAGLFRMAMQHPERLAHVAPTPDWRFPRVPVWVDGLCREVSQLYDAYAEWVHPEWRALTEGGGVIFDADGLVRPVQSVAERERLCAQESPAIIIASSGMLTGGTSVVYARALAPEPNAAIYLCGYQDEESAGGRLRRLTRRTGGETHWRLGDDLVPVRCAVAQYQLSAHADGPMLMRLASAWRPRTLLLGHGSPERLDSLKGHCEHLPALTDTTIVVPAIGERVSIEARSRAEAAMPAPWLTERVAGIVSGYLIDRGEGSPWSARQVAATLGGSLSAWVQAGRGGQWGTMLVPCVDGTRPNTVRLDAELQLAMSMPGIMGRAADRAIRLDPVDREDTQPPPTLMDVRQRLQTRFGRGARSHANAEAAQVLAATPMRPGDLILGEQFVGGTAHRFPAIALYQDRFLVHTFAPTAIDPTLGAWQVVGRLWQGTPFSGEAAWVTSQDWAWLDMLQSAADVEVSVGHEEPHAHIWGLVADGLLPPATGTLASLIAAGYPSRRDVVVPARDWQAVLRQAGGDAATHVEALRRQGLADFHDEGGAVHWRWRTAGMEPLPEPITRRLAQAVGQRSPLPSR